MWGLWPVLAGMLLKKPGVYQLRSSESQKRWRRTAWLLVWGFCALRMTKAEHRHVFYFTAVGTTSSLLNFTMVSFIDDIQLYSYNKPNQIQIKMDGISNVLAANFSEQVQRLLMIHGEHFHRLICYLEQNDTKSEKSHTLQLFAGCELEGDIQVDQHVHLAWDGEDLFRRDEQQGYWVFVNPTGYILKPAVESAFWDSVRKHYMQEYCFDTMRKILRHAKIKENVPPEVTVSRHDVLDGTVTLSCTATGFYPHFILLSWEKGYEHAIWGKESSSGTLPNADGTFYLQVTLELLPGDPGIGYTCVVEHKELKEPAVYPVPRKPTKEKPWAMALAVMTIVLLGVSCALAFIVRKEKKTALAHGPT